ncbi:uncharacterized protein LOC141899215 [Tubulanus polymorphus]|uniref:uncharacterized protein LOC141899215 n=1 Tax=Tubulanus polymorphus TaxID=672921 RepID=UPI003DA4A3FF
MDVVIDEKFNQSERPVKFNQSEPARDVNENVDTQPIGDLGLRKKQWEQFMLQSIVEQSTATKTSPLKINGPSQLHYSSLAGQQRNNGLPRQQYVESTTIAAVTVATDETDSNMRNGSENIVQREIREQQRREMALRTEREKTLLTSPRLHVNNNMSVLELEIKLQQERELEATRQRELVRQISPTISPNRNTAVHSPNGIHSPPPSSVRSQNHHVQSPSPSGGRSQNHPVQTPSPSGGRSQNHPVQTPSPSGGRVQSPPSRNYPEMQSSPSIESIIRKEIEELNLRESELQAERESMGLKSSVIKHSDYLSDLESPRSQPDSESPRSQPNLDSPRSRPNPPNQVSLRGRAVSAPSTPIAPTAPSDLTDSTVEEHETAVEKERRISVTRDAEYRRLRGLSVPLPPRTVKLEVNIKPRPSAPVRKVSTETTDGLRNLASSRLQMEIERERKRELDLKKEGKIRTTSEDHIGEPVLQPSSSEIITAPTTPSSTTTGTTSTTTTTSPESLIELEIKRQKLREEEIRKLRQKAGSP